MGGPWLISLIFVLFSEKVAANHFITISPEKPYVGRQATITCTYSGAQVMQLQILVPNVAKQGDYVMKITLNTKNYKYKVEELSKNWKSADEYIVSTKRLNATGGQLQLTFKNVKPEDNLMYESASYIPLTIRKLHMDVQTAPEISALQLILPNSTVSWRIMAGLTVNIKCTVRMGNPEASDSGIAFNAPGRAIGALKVEKEEKDLYKYTLKTFVLQRTLQTSDDGRLVECSGVNPAGRGSKRQRLSVLYGTQNVRFSVLPNANVSGGDEIKCSAAGNPAPKVRIFAVDQTNRDAGWVSSEATGYSEAVLEIPQKATLGRFFISCNASNTFKSVAAQKIAVNVVTAPTTTPVLLPVTSTTDSVTANSGDKQEQRKAPNEKIKPVAERSMFMAAVIGGLVAFLVLIIIICIIYCQVKRRQKSSSKHDRPEHDKGPYDIDDLDKPGSRLATYSSTRSYPPYDTGYNRQEPTGGSNGNQHCAPEADTSVDHPLNYASLDFEETPRSRKPIVFDDKVEYAEIVPSSGDATINFEEDHTYENVRHHNV